MFFPIELVADRFANHVSVTVDQRLNVELVMSGIDRAGNIGRRVPSNRAAVLGCLVNGGQNPRQQSFKIGRRII